MKEESSVSFLLGRDQQTRPRGQITPQNASAQIVPNSHQPTGPRRPIRVNGVIFKLFYTGRFHRISTVIYILMGWLVMVAMISFAASAP